MNMIQIKNSFQNFSSLHQYTERLKTLYTLLTDVHILSFILLLVEAIDFIINDLEELNKLGIYSGKIAALQKFKDYLRNFK